MIYSRRDLLKTAGIAGLSATAIHPVDALAEVAQPLFPDGYPDRKELIKIAVDAAISAGASYADARLSHIETLDVNRFYPGKGEVMAFGVRALYDGYWGFAAGPNWSKEEAARLGKAALAQAKANVLGRERITDLAPMAEITEGHWQTPVKYDPWRMDFAEIADYFTGLTSYIRSLKFVSFIIVRHNFRRINKAFGSSAGQFVTQSLYDASGAISFSLSDKERNTNSGAFIDEVSIAGYGFEYFRDRPLREYIRIAHEEAVKNMALPVKPIDPARYNVLIDQHGMANLLSQSIGTATEIDRVFGFEANAGGTSYINEPEAMLGNFKIGSPLLNITCDRSAVGSVGRVKWDDEGVSPVAYDLVKDGVLINLQTNREGASWIGDYLSKSGQKLTSFGCANAPSAMDTPLVHKADLLLKPADSGTLDDLRGTIDDGVEIRAPGIAMDFQQITGMANGEAYEIKKGKRVARLHAAGMLFRTPELWSNMTAVGGEESVMYYGITSEKGQPSQSTSSGVYAPPAAFKEMTLIDITRKA